MTNDRWSLVPEGHDIDGAPVYPRDALEERYQELVARVALAGFGTVWSDLDAAINYLSTGPGDEDRIRQAVDAALGRLSTR